MNTAHVIGGIIIVISAFAFLLVTIAVSKAASRTER